MVEPKYRIVKEGTRYSIEELKAGWLGKRWTQIDYWLTRQDSEEHLKRLVAAQQNNGVLAVYDMNGDRLV